MPAASGRNCVGHLTRLGSSRKKQVVRYSPLACFPISSGYFQVPAGVHCRGMTLYGMPSIHSIPAQGCPTALSPRPASWCLQLVLPKKPPTPSFLRHPKIFRGVLFLASYLRIIGKKEVMPVYLLAVTVVSCNMSHAGLRELENSVRTRNGSWTYYCTVSD